MVWYNLEIGSFKAKYTPLSVEEKDFPYCDSEGNILKKVSGKFERGHFLNESNGEKHDKAFRLINGKASEGFKGRVKSVKPTMVDKGESEDLLVEKEFLLECPQLYNELKEKNQEVLCGGWFGNGFKGYRIYIVPSELFKGFCIMKAGRGKKSDIIRGLVESQNEIEDLKNKLESIDLTIDKVNQVKVEDLLEI